MIEFQNQGRLTSAVITSTPYTSEYEAILSDAELIELDSIQSAVRRRTYAASRWLGKRLVAERLDTLQQSLLSGTMSPDSGLSAIEILSRDRDGRPSRPVVKIDGRRTNHRLSISHQQDRVFVVLADRSVGRIGCDLEQARVLNQGFLDLWFSEAEEDWLATDQRDLVDQQTRSQAVAGRGIEMRSRDILATAIWSAKEASYKALNDGESFVPRRVEIVATKGTLWRCRYGGRNSDVSCDVAVKVCGREIFAVATQV